VGFCDLLKSRIFLFGMVMSWRTNTICIYTVHDVQVFNLFSSSLLFLFLLFLFLLFSTVCILRFNLEVPSEYFPILGI